MQYNRAVPSPMMQWPYELPYKIWSYEYFPEILWHIQHHQNSNVDNDSPRPVQFYPLTESDFGFSNEENVKFPEKMDSLSAHTKIPLLYQTEILHKFSNGRAIIQGTYPDEQKFHMHNS